MKLAKRMMVAASASVITGLMAAQDAQAASANNFSNIAKNINTSIQDLPGLLTAVSYMMGLIFAVMGVLKIKDHVENPTQKPLKDGAIALAAGGALFALPIVLEAMRETVGNGTTVDAATLKKMNFNVN
jgi:intracellular multiplication protein IcmD